MFLVELYLVIILSRLINSNLTNFNILRLNEGFARLLQYNLVDMFYPEWRMQHFMNVLTVQTPAMITDARTNTRAMTSNAETPAEISALFDNIAYDKSAAVIRMFEYAVGERLFRDSLHLYVATK